MRPAGHLVPTAALVCAALAGWLAVPLDLALVASGAALATAPRRLAFALVALGVGCVAAVAGAPHGVAPETLVELRRLLDAVGPAGAAAAVASTVPLRAVAAVVTGPEWGGVALGLALRFGGLVGLGALMRRVPELAWRRLGWTAGSALASLGVAFAAL